MSEQIVLTVNGVAYPVAIEQSRNLVSVIRTEVGLTGTKEGCDDCECGACMVLLDGQPVPCPVMRHQRRAGGARGRHRHGVPVNREKPAVAKPGGYPFRVPARAGGAIHIAAICPNIQPGHRRTRKNGFVQVTPLPGTPRSPGIRCHTSRTATSRRPSGKGVPCRG